MEESRWLSALVGGPVPLKCENLQRTGSFKVRGAYIRISRLTEEERARGVVAASAGNHAQGVALAAQLLGIKATVFMPEGAPIPKEKATRAYGADVRLPRPLPRGRAGRGRASSPTETGAVLIHPFDHVDIVAGQGTVGLEILEQAPDVRDRARADRRRRPARRDRDRGQGAAPRRAGGRRAGGGRRGLPAPRWRPARPVPLRVDDHDGRRHRGRAARATSPSRPCATTSTRSSPSPRSRCRARCWPLLERAKLVVEPAGAAAVAALLDDPTAFETPAVGGAVRRQHRPAAARQGDPARPGRRPAATSTCASASPTCPAGWPSCSPSVGAAGRERARGRARAHLADAAPRRGRGAASSSRPAARRTPSS